MNFNKLIEYYRRDDFNELFIQITQMYMKMSEVLVLFRDP